MAALFCFLSSAGCPPKPLTQQPIVVIAEHALFVPAGKSFIPPSDGYWLSREMMARLLEKLEDLQYRLDSMPKAEIDHHGGPSKGVSPDEMPPI